MCKNKEDCIGEEERSDSNLFSILINGDNSNSTWNIWSMSTVSWERRGEGRK